MTDPVLYSTIATIVGVWLSLVISLGLVLFTYINNQNTHFFNSVRNEKRKFYSSIDYLVNDIEDITFTRVLSDEISKNKCIAENDSIKSICDNPGDPTIKNIQRNIDAIYASIKSIVSCYPHPHGLGSRFLYSENLPLNDKEEDFWIKTYRYRISFYFVKKTFRQVNSYFDFITPNVLSTANLSKISTLRCVMKKLETIDYSIYEIETLKRDYNPIVNVLKIIKS